jgi:hypothetical protein
MYLTESCMDCNFMYVQIYIPLYFCCLQSAQNRLLIKNGKVVNEDGMVDSDVYVEDGVVK